MQLEAAIKEADKDGDGNVDYIEFIEMMLAKGEDDSSSSSSSEEDSD